MPALDRTQGLFLTHHAFWLAFCAILAISAVRHLRSDELS